MLSQRIARLILLAVPPLLKQVEEDGIKHEIESVGQLSQFASNYPYYKYACGLPSEAHLAFPPLSSPNEVLTRVSPGTTIGGPDPSRMSSVLS